MTVTRSLGGRRALSIALTTSLAGTAFFALSGTSIAAPGSGGVASPAEGTVAAGTVVTVTGTGFKDAAGVLNVKTNGAGIPRVIAAAGTCTDAATAAAGAGAAFTFSVLSATKLTAKLPAHTAGAVKLCLPVVASTGTHTANAYVSVPYVYAAQPTAGSLDHNAGPSYGGQTVVATSTVAWRVGSTSVTVGGVPATGVKVATGGASLSFTTPAGSGTGKDVVVKTPGFAPVTFSAAYDWENALKVTPQVVDPAGDSIDIVGSGFEDATLYPNGVGVYVADGSGSEPECNNISVVSDTEITCDLPAHTAAAVSIVVGDDVTPGTFSALTGASVVTSGSTVTFSTY